MEKGIIKAVIRYFHQMENPKENILELLLVAQKEAGGVVPLWLQEEMSDMLELSLEEIAETVEFFPFLREKPEKSKVSICMGISCFMGGNGMNESMLKEKKGIGFEIEYTECNDVCEYGPRISVGHKIFQFADENSVREIIDYISEGGENENKRGIL